MKFCFGVDLGGTSAKIGLFTYEGNLVDKREIPTRTTIGLDAIFSDIADSIRDIANKSSVEYRQCGVGIGIPGPVERNGFVESCVNLSLNRFYPAETLSAKLDGVRVEAANDANAAALGEMWQGGGKGYKSLVAVTLGTGVGSGVILDEKIVYGTRGMAGEIGHVSVNPAETEICNCGGKGCLDQVASATGVVRYAHKILADCDAPSILRGCDSLSAKTVLDAAKQGDALAAQTVSYCMSFLGKSLSDVGHVVDPEVFVIGGGLSNAGSYLLDEIYRQYQQHQILKKAGAKFALATLGNDAGIYGAARLVL